MRQEIEKASGHLSHVTEAAKLLSDSTTLVEVMQWRAAHQSQQLALQFLPDSKEDIAHTAIIRWDYAALDRQAQAIASHLQAQGFDNQRLLLVYPDGLDFVAAFLGCLYASAVAVPVHPPRRASGVSDLQRVIAEAQIACVLTTDKLLPDLAPLCAQKSRQTPQPMDDPTDIPCLATDLLPVAALSATWQPSPPDPASIALLQYTSGSSAHPKGVVVTHANLLHNERFIYQRFGHSPHSHVVSWLPYYHDMGLIGSILQPLYGGFPLTLMSPAAFLRRPSRWLQAITHFGATTSGAPDFAYAHCVEKITPLQRQQLDLRSWTVAFSGAEPVHAATLSRFTETFAECGFGATTFYPCYGLAEATLMVTGGMAGTTPDVRSVARPALAQGQVLTAPPEAADSVQLVGCGRAADDTTLAIVDPQTLVLCPPEQVGEIWVSGPSVAQGYWQQPEATAQTFNAFLPDGSGPFLRTGDLGVLQDGVLWVTGRHKDRIIIRGQNHYPQDIEQTVAHSHVALQPGCGAAFGLEIEGTERLVVVQEVARSAWRTLDAAAVFEAIRAAVSRQHGLQVYAIQLLKVGSMPMTSSGKIQRQACKSGYLTRTLPAMAQWQLAPAVPSAARAPLPPAAAARPTSDADSRVRTEALIQWLRHYATTSINSRLMDERRSLSPGVVLDFGNQGLLGMQAPAAYGGLALGHGDMLRVLEQLGAIDLTLALFVGLNNVLGLGPILRAAPPALREDLLPRLASGRELAAFALTEPGAGSHPHGIMATARPTAAGGWRLRGQKIWSGSAAWAGVITIFVQQRDAMGQPAGISGFAVRKGTPGLRQGPEALTMGMRGMVQNTIYLEDVPVNAAQMLGAPGAGMAVAQEAMMHGRLAIAAASVGGMKRCAQLMARYSSRRTIAGGRLLENPLWLSRLNGLTAAITAVEALVYLIAQRRDQGIAVPQEAYAACKIMAPELYWQAADTLVQCLGGRGYIETNMAPQILRDARVLRIFEGPTETLAMFLGARVLSQPAALQAFLVQDLAAPEIAQTLFETATQILQRYTARKVPFADEAVGRRQACLVIGELTAVAILLAAAQHGLAQQADPARQRAVVWTRSHFDHKCAQAQRLTPDEAVVLSVAATTAWIAGYATSIGDVEQTLAGEDQDLDALLRQADPVAADVAPGDRLPTAPAVSEPPVAATPVRHQAPGVPQTVASLQHWLCHWLAQRLQIVEATIDPEKAFADYGLDSVLAVELAQALEDAMGLTQPLDATLVWNFPTLQTLAVHLATGLQGTEAPSARTPQAHRAEAPDLTLAGRSVPVVSGATTGLEGLSEAELAQTLAAEIAVARGRHR